MRDCNKCIHHISGSCSAWECEMQTLEEYRNEVIDEFAEKIFEYCSMSDMNRKMIKQIAEQMKAGGENEWYFL